VSVSFIKSKEQLRKVVMDAFRQKANKISYVREWLLAFLLAMYHLLFNGLSKG